MRAAAVGRAALAVALFSASASRGLTQISPGPLSRPHAKLQGNTHCLECHERGRGVAPAKCFACHQPLERRTAAGKGLHARPEYGNCKKCHVEHQGADFALVFWGKQGPGTFDHAQTGQPLSGKHARLSCGQCHKTRSYLGLATACGSCHRDEHRGQFAGRACTDCHGEQAWTPARFDHAATRWALSGGHASVACAKCHATSPDPARAGSSYRAFRGAATDCAGCHKDVHSGRLGRACAGCHSTTVWRTVRAAGFDHGKTAYRLTGAHAAVACDKCHKSGRALRLRHERCTDCHADAHRPFARSLEAARCEGCHDQNAFRPARFAAEDHARTAYPLSGAHLAVACDECHRPAAPRAHLVSRSGRSPATLSLQLPGKRRCADCHADPHGAAVARAAAPNGCESCHQVDSWRAVPAGASAGEGSFRHDATGYALSGRHARVACDGCHRPSPNGARARLRFAGAPRTCAACHRDPHAGQFAEAGRATACDRCHATDTLKASRFDHARDSSYRLDGAHVRLACAACHKPEDRGGTSVVRYKPEPKTCSGCHGPGRRTAEGGRP